MADDRRDYNEEYQYADIDLAQEAEQEPPVAEAAPATQRARFNFSSLAKKILIPVVVVAAIYVVYQFIGPEQATTPVDLGQQATTNQNNSETSVTGSVATTNSGLGQDMATSLAQSDLMLENQFRQLKTAQSQTSAQLQTLADNYKNLADKYSNIQSQLSGIQASIKNLNIKLTAPKPQTKPVAKQAPRRVPVTPKITYQLKALVPGRAWLQASTGKTVTVKVGDKLAGYGLVTAIDTTQGWVTTSSGSYIGYGADDA